MDDRFIRRTSFRPDRFTDELHLDRPLKAPMSRMDDPRCKANRADGVDLPLPITHQSPLTSSSEELLLFGEIVDGEGEKIQTLSSWLVAVVVVVADIGVIFSDLDLIVVSH